MFTSFNEERFWKAINEKDLSRLKINTISAIRNDPTFARDETEKVLYVLDEKVPEIFEDEKDLGYEERLDSSAWSKAYFTKLTCWFEENFAKSRLEHIKEVGRVVHKDTEQNYKQSIAIKTGSRENGRVSRNQNSDKRYANRPTKAPGKTKRWPLIVGGIAAAAALVLIVVLLIKMLTK